MKKETPLKSLMHYAEILQTFGVAYTPAGYYCQVGEIKGTQGWILYLSVVLRELPDLLHKVIPELMIRQAAFKIAQDTDTADRLLEGTLGYANLGNVLVIYPETEGEANELAQRLIQLTGSYRGPAVPTGRHLGGIVYTRYGSFNPVIMYDVEGRSKEFIYDQAGNLVPDPYFVPFEMMKGVRWPFAEIAEPLPPARRKLLNYAYYPLKVIKPDAKGAVIRGIYFKKFWQIRHCIIKEGHHDMLTDGAGRDIRARLKWQYDLYQALHAEIPMPEIFDYFEEYGDAYLAMQFIQGISITSLIADICQDRSWRHLAGGERLLLLDKLLEILTIIQQLHEKGYVHRDITPDNFLVDKKGKIFLIDMELSWCLNTGLPDPPFKLGTEGHISPEQRKAKPPTVKEDIYGIGALMIVIFTSLPAMKVNCQDVGAIEKALDFLTGSSLLAEITAACFREHPSDRPELPQLLDVLRDYRENMIKEEGAQSAIAISETFIRQRIEAGIAGLVNEILCTSGSRWISILQRNETRIGNMQLEITIYKGWHTGMAGPLWLLARAQMAGYAVDDCLPTYYANWEYLQTKQFIDPEHMPPGLYSGSAGIAMAIIEGLNSGILNPDQDTISKLASCFLIRAESCELAEGVAGQGIALLNAEKWLDPAWTRKVFEVYMDLLLGQQREDGSWLLIGDPTKKEDILTGLDRGMAGIVWFLVNYMDRHPEAKVESALLRALGWLSSQARKPNKNYFWTIGTQSQSVARWSVGHGIPGIILTLIRAYEVLKDPQYRELAASCLRTIPPNPARIDYTLGDGLAGLGEVYLEAHRVLGEGVWRDRADWIAGLLIHCPSELGDGAIAWQTHLGFTLTSDLFSGSSGVLHFLIRFASDQHTYHPLIPRSIS